MKFIKVKKGFTLIEIIITMAILFIVLGILSPLLNYNLKSLYTTENKNDLQREAYNAMEIFTKKAMEAKNISQISTDINDLTSSSVITRNTEQTGIRYIELTRDDGVKYTFKLDSNKSLKENDTAPPIAGDVIDIIVQPLSKDASGSIEKLGECSTIKVTFKFSKHLLENDPYVVTSEIKFRNN